MVNEVIIEMIYRKGNKKDSMLIFRDFSLILLCDILDIVPVQDHKYDSN